MLAMQVCFAMFNRRLVSGDAALISVTDPYKSHYDEHLLVLAGGSLCE